MVHQRINGWLHNPHRTPGRSEPLSLLQLELGTLFLRVRDAGDDVARRQSKRQLVRVVEDYYSSVGGQVE